MLRLIFRYKPTYKAQPKLVETGKVQSSLKVFIMELKQGIVDSRVVTHIHVCLVYIE